VAEVLKVGIIGCGAIARAHLDAIAGLESIEAVALADKLPHRAEAYAAEYAVKNAYTNIEHLLADPDVQGVHVCLPHYLHLSTCLRAAAAGKHMLVEKPLALSVAEANEMIAAAEANGVTFMVGHLLRFRTVNREAKRIIAEGGIGVPRSVINQRLDCPDPEAMPAWYRDPKKIGNFAIYGYGTHQVDTILWTLDTFTRRAFSSGRVVNPVWGNQDEVQTILELASGAMVCYSQSLNSPTIASHSMYVGTEGTLSVSATHLGLNGQTVEIPTAANQGMTAQIQEFALSCLERREPESSAGDCLRTQRTLDAMWESVQTGRVVEVSA